jgi:hypothetical protein
MKFTLLQQRLKKNLRLRPYLQHKQVWCISARARRITRNVAQYGLLVFLIVVLILWIGADVQSDRADQSEGTAYLYNTSHVCAMDFPAQLLEATRTNSTIDITELPEAFDPIVIETFDNPENATEEESVTIAHCGDCGACSNPNDIRIYDETKDSLFESSYKCSKRGLFSGKKNTRRCLKEAIGFTDECNECWVENIMCDFRLCIFACMWHAIFSQVNSDSEDQQALNRCTECDEKRCGPAFVKCAGANRRRSGILSEFERDLDNEFCQHVDNGWWNDKNLQTYWLAQNSDSDSFT